ncbi:hypothetical protein E2C01_072117 [Portunus trituberculatus]|uniref:Uncharacterized protein n=1 Tax=Portunus trituberculatus TaxID=210409 RepID=A0A5B7I9V6_PORTR|nr:hypothetical protein [Portunus trituberculatus]
MAAKSNNKLTFFSESITKPDARNSIHSLEFGQVVMMAGERTISPPQNGGQASLEYQARET